MVTCHSTYTLCLHCNPEYIFAHIDLGLLEINSGNFEVEFYIFAMLSVRQIKKIPLR